MAAAEWFFQHPISRIAPPPARRYWDDDARGMPENVRYEPPAPAEPAESEDDQGCSLPNLPPDLQPGEAGGVAFGFRGPRQPREDQSPEDHVEDVDVSGQIRFFFPSR